jgi:hypothetical protein
MDAEISDMEVRILQMSSQTYGLPPIALLGKWKGALGKRNHVEIDTLISASWSPSLRDELLRLMAVPVLQKRSDFFAYALELAVAVRLFPSETRPSISRIKRNQDYIYEHLEFTTYIPSQVRERNSSNRSEGVILHDIIAVQDAWDHWVEKRKDPSSVDHLHRILMAKMEDLPLLTEKARLEIATKVDVWIAGEYGDAKSTRSLNGGMKTFSPTYLC